MTLEQEFVRLAWCLLERKYVYYESPAGIEPEADSVYDEHEARYIFLAELLGKTPTVSEAPGFPGERPSARLAARVVRARGLTPWPCEAGSEPQANQTETCPIKSGIVLKFERKRKPRATKPTRGRGGVPSGGDECA